MADTTNKRTLPPLKIGSVCLENPVILAPMAGVTDFPFRQIARACGHKGLVVSEMVASRAITESFKNPSIAKRMHFLDRSQEKPPIAIQLVGYDPEIMAEAARFNEQLGATTIDINMGCPVKKVVNTEAGAALMKDEPLAGRIIETVVRSVSIPVTVKMRLGWSAAKQNAAVLARIAENAGAAAVTVHARTRAQFYEGTADWSALAPIKAAINIPLIANGDIRSPEDAHLAFKQSGADGVMVGRGALGCPWILRSIAANFAGIPLPPPPTPKQRLATILQHIEEMVGFYGEEKGVILARKHLGWYSKSMPGSAEFRMGVNAETQYTRLLERIHHFFAS